MAVYTLFGQPASPASLTNDSADYTMSVQFSVSGSGCTLTGIWFWSAPGAFSLPETIALFAVSGQTLVHSEPATWSGAAGSGWVKAAFSSPPSLTASAAYKACIFSNSGNFFYSGTSHYWDTGPGASGISDGPLSAPPDSGADGGQDTFNAGSVLAYPDTSFNAANYWVDPEVTAVSGVAHTATASLTVTPSLSAARQRGTYRTASLTVTPTRTAARTRGTYRTAALTVTPALAAARTAARFRQAHLTPALAFTAARTAGRHRTAALLAAPVLTASRTAGRHRVAVLVVTPSLHAAVSGGAVHLVLFSAGQAQLKWSAGPARNQ